MPSRGSGSEVVTTKGGSAGLQSWPKRLTSKSGMQPEVPAMVVDGGLVKCSRPRISSENSLWLCSRS